MKISWSDLVNKSDLKEELINNRSQRFIVPTFEGEDVELTGGTLLVNYLLLHPLHKRNILPLKKFLYTGDEAFTDEVRKSVENSVIFHPVVLKDYRDSKQEIYEELYYATNELSDIIATMMASEFRSISMIEIAHTMQDPEIKKVLAFDPDKYLKQSLKSLEVATEKHNKKVVKALKEIKKNNCFRPYLVTKSLNEGQFFQSVCLGGTRTDVDDTAVKAPIRGNYIEGLRGDIEYIIESFSSRKSEDYSKEHMGTASYTKRKINLMASALCNIYPGSCESDVTLTYTIPPSMKKGYIGRNVKEKDGSMTTLTKDNLDSYVGREIELYSPVTCAHTDGCCHRCGGFMLEMLPPNTKIGQAATEQVMNPLQQSILSAKHLMKTLIQLFNFPKPLDEIFKISDGNIYIEDFISKDLDISKLRIGVPTEGVQNISELNEFHGESLPGSYFSAIPSISIANNETGEIIIPLTDVVNEAKIIPHFTGEFLSFLKRNKDHIVYNGSMMWFMVEGFDKDQPIMGVNYVSEAAYVFIQKIEQFFARDAKDGGISKYKSAAAAIYDLSELLWHRIACNSIWIELLIKSALVHDDADLSIPRVYDAEGVIFGKMPQINTYRCISNEAAFQRWSDYVIDPKTYVTPTKSGIFDPYIGSEDYQHPERFANRTDLATY